MFNVGRLVFTPSFILCSRVMIRGFKVTSIYAYLQEIMYLKLEDASRKGCLKTLAVFHLIECTIIGTFHHNLGDESFLTQAKKKKSIYRETKL